MQRVLRPGVVVGLAATAGVFAAAAMMSAATAPTARADDFSDIINAVDGDFANGQAEFATAYSDFGSSDVNDGLTAFLSAVDDDALAAPNNLIAGSIEALTNETITGSDPIGLLGSSSFSLAVTVAESTFAAGETYFTDGATDFASGDYGYGAIYDLFASDYVSIVPLQELLLGAVGSF